MAEKFDTAAVDRAYRIASVFMDAEKRQHDERRMREFVERRNKENWR